MKLSAFGIACVLSPLSLAGCATPSPGDFCSTYRPVYSPQNAVCDELIREQVDENNAVYLCTCTEECEE